MIGDVPEPFPNFTVELLIRPLSVLNPLGIGRDQELCAGEFWAVDDTFIRGFAAVGVLG